MRLIIDRKIMDKQIRFCKDNNIGIYFKPINKRKCEFTNYYYYGTYVVFMDYVNTFDRPRVSKLRPAATRTMLHAVFK